MMPTELRYNAETGEAEEIDVAPLPLPLAKAALWDLAKNKRDSVIDAGYTVPGVGRFDTDQVARFNIVGAVIGAILANTQGQQFSTPWKLADNTLITLDGPGMIGVGVAVLNYVKAAHSRSQAIGAAIQAAQNHAALDAIDLTAGWPG